MRKNYYGIRNLKHAIWQSRALSFSVAFFLIIGLTTKADTVLASRGLESYTLGKVLEIQAAAPDANAGPDKMLSCKVTSVQLEGSSTTPGATFSWTAGSGGNIVSGANTATPIVDAAANYTLTVTVNGVSSTDVMLVDKERAHIDVGTREINCAFPTKSLFGRTNIEGATFSWTGPNGFTSSDQNIIVGEGGGGTYTLTVTNPKTGCEVTDEAYIFDNIRRPLADAGPDQVLTCSKTEVTLTGSTDPNRDLQMTDFQWFDSEGNRILEGVEKPNLTVSTPGTYVLQVVDPMNGCTARDTVVVSRDESSLEVFVSTVAPAHLECGGDNSVLLSGVARINGEINPGGTIFSWTGPNGFTSSERAIEATVGGVYTVTATLADSGCSGSGSITVTGPFYPSGSAGPDKVLSCNASTVVLEGAVESQDLSYWVATDGGNIVSGGGTPNPVVDAPGTYILYITSGHTGCTIQDTVVVTQDESMPNIVVTHESINCTTTQVTASTRIADAVFSWTGPNGFVSSDPVITVTAYSEFSLTITNPATGCSASTSIGVYPPVSGTPPVCSTIDFNSHRKGLLYMIETESGPVSIMGRKRNPDGTYATGNYAAIFDTQTPTGDDTDLYTTDWGHALIINQDQTNEPNDNLWGGELILDYSAIGPVTMESLKALDIDSYEGMSWVYLYDGDGKELYKVQLQNLGNNSKQTVDLGNTRGVMKMKIVLDGRNESGHFAGSGAIDDIKFCVDGEPGTPCEDEAAETMAAGISNATAYPNPFQGKANVKFRLQESENYVVNLYDTQGNLVRELKSGKAQAGKEVSIEVDGSNLLEGLYFARIVSKSGAKTIKLIIKK